MYPSCNTVCSRKLIAIFTNRHAALRNPNHQEEVIYCWVMIFRTRQLEGRIQKFPDWIDNEITTAVRINTHWEATQRVMEAKLTRLAHKIALQLHLVAENSTICRSLQAASPETFRYILPWRWHRNKLHCFLLYHHLSSLLLNSFCLLPSSYSCPLPLYFHTAFVASFFFLFLLLLHLHLTFLTVLFLILLLRLQFSVSSCAFGLWRDMQAAIYVFYLQPIRQIKRTKRSGKTLEVVDSIKGELS
jgi:hypothetical protein